MTTETETHLRELLAKATPGEWLTRGPKMQDGAPDFAIYVTMNERPQILAEAFGRSDKDVYFPSVDNAVLIAALHNAAPALLDELEALREQYHELLFAVGNKYEGETRHQTALKYIHRAEAGDPYESALAALDKAEKGEQP